MDSLADFGFLLKDISRLYSRNFERHASAVGLSLADARVLRHLQRNPGLSQARLAWLTETDPMTLGRTVKRLESEGLIERRPCAKDGRAITLRLRSEAAPLLKTTAKLSRRALEEALAGLGVAERTRLLKTMRAIHANLDALVPGFADRGLPAERPAARPSRRAAGGVRRC